MLNSYSAEQMDDLLERWKKADLRPIRVEEFERLLVEKFGFYRIPADACPQLIYERDDELIGIPSILLTCTNEDSIARLKSGVDFGHREDENAEDDQLALELALKSMFPDETDWVAELDTAWQCLYDPDPEIPDRWSSLSYRLLEAQYQHQQRVSIPIETDGPFVFNRKVEGTAFVCDEFLWWLTCLTGIPEAPPGSDPQDKRYVRHGDLGDFRFREYLEVLELGGAI
ncbi:MAG: hypothetical protein LBU38_02150 [Propionibacteriaceae bacterium]|jgi:hypothetical protein|nr:hypothetical protein [Propionibacteriaceae bacterium]